jgi:hypothetical protein
LQPGCLFCSVSVYGDRAAVGCAAGAVHIWDLRAGRLEAEVRPITVNSVTSVVLQRGVLVAGDVAANLHIWVDGSILPAAQGALAEAGVTTGHSTATSSPYHISTQQQESGASSQAPAVAAANVDRGAPTTTAGSSSSSSSTGWVLVGIARQGAASWVRSIIVQGGMLASCGSQDPHVRLHACPPVAAAALGMQPVGQPGWPGHWYNQSVEPSAATISLRRMTLGTGRTASYWEIEDDEDGPAFCIRSGTDGGQALRMVCAASWQLAGSSGSSHGAALVSGPKGREVQAYALAADQWGCYAGCTDGAIRCWVLGSDA